jgi:chromosome segregation ATPase
MTWKAAQQAAILLQDERRRTEELKAKYDNLRMEMETALKNEKHTVSVLVSEKVHLASKVEKLEDAESSAFCAHSSTHSDYRSEYQVLEDSLEAERAKCVDLDERASQVQTEFRDLSRRFQETKMKEKESLDHTKEMVFQSS